MKKWMFVHIMMLAGTQLFAQGTYQEKVNNYVQKYKDLAMAEQQRSGIPACITLGQGILETSAGCSELMTQANNHFGIKCKKEWMGETFAHTDDAPNECFRKYKCDLDSYKDHSDYLKTSQRYASLFMLSPTDYKGWAFGLKRCGYATNPRYAQQLIKIIEDFHLQDYTLAAANNPIPTKEASMVVAAAQPVTVAVVPQQALTDTVKPMPVITQANLADNTAKVNGLRAFYAHKGDVLLEYAIRYNMRYAKLLELNDLPDAPLEADMFVYLERKNSKGAHEQHYVQPGETLLQIAQAEGMQLKQLRTLNQLGDNDQPVTGTVLNCQQPAGAKPAVKSMTVTNEPAYASNTNAAGNSDYITKPAAVNPEPVRTALQPVAAMDNNTPVQEEEEKAPVTVAEKKEQPVSAPVTEKKETPPPPVRVVRAAPQPAPRTMNRADEPFNIANEKAVEETVVRNNPRYVDRSADNNAPVNNWPAATTPASNTAADQAPAPAPEPQDELSKLKAKLDKVVYGDSRPSGSAIKVTNDPTPVYTASTQAPAAPVQTVTAQPESNGAAQYYTVTKGDTAFGIAKKHNITVKQLMDWNHLDFDGIKTGQKLRVK